MSVWFSHSLFTESAILQFVTNAHQLLDEKYFVVVENFGITGIPLQLFQSYLDSRSQSAYCNYVYSCNKNISSGVT